MSSNLSRSVRRNKRKKRIRKKIFGVNFCPRLTVFRSLSHFYAQIINDDTQSTLISCSSVEVLKERNDKLSKKEIAELVGLKIAEKSKEKNISKVVFDRNGYIYHGRVKAFADQARKSGLIF